MKTPQRFCYLCLPLLLLLAVGTSLHTPLRAQLGFTQTGEASFYADRFHGRKTASGDKYNKNELSAAHRELAFGTRVRVQNLDNGKSVVVTINDRGPWRSHRVIDLSKRAAQDLDMMQSGVAQVKLVVIGDNDSGDKPVADKTPKRPETPANKPSTPASKPQSTPQSQKPANPQANQSASTSKPTPTPTQKPAPQATEKSKQPPKETPAPVAKQPAAPKAKPFSEPGTWNMYGDKLAPQGWGLQLGTFTTSDNAVKFCNEVREKGYKRLFVQQIGQGSSASYKVLLGVYDTADVARSHVAELKSKGLNAFPAQHIK